jgi:hypothetical protein
MDSGKRNNTKVVGYLDGFPVGINTPLSDEWSRSNDLWNSGGVAGISSF